MSPFQRGVLIGVLAPIHLLWILVNVPVRLVIGVVIWLLFGGFGLILAATDDLLSQLHYWWQMYTN